MYYLSFLESMHQLLAPQTYLEIGVRNGSSLAKARCRAVGIDPAFAIREELDCEVALFRTSSDEYFDRADPLQPTDGRRFDLAFIDGLHLFEFSLRDFINVERVSSPKSVIVFDDMLPRSVDEAARVKHTVMWTGDVYPIIEVLARYRPELTVLPVATQPTGLLLVMGLDPDNPVLTENYDAIVAEYRHEDPQPVPAELMDRMSIVPPERVLAADFWSVLADASAEATTDSIRPALAASLAPQLGAGFTGVG